MTKQEIIKQCTAGGNVLRLPNINLERNDYLEIKKVMESYGGKWKGGKVAGFVFDGREASDVLQMIKGDGCENMKKDFQFFATPDWVADMMVDDLSITSSDKVLEPSAGTGSLVKAVLRKVDNISVDCYELNELNRKALADISNINLIGADFLERADKEEYSVIIANPPFAKNQDIIHIMKMYENLCPGGRMACISSSHWVFSQDKKSVEFRQWLKNKCDHYQELPANTFKESGTSTATMYLVIRKKD